MASPTKPKTKDKPAKAAKPGKPEEKAKKPKKAKEKDQAVEAAPAPVAEAPRPPADPRMKVVKKFEKRLLPKGPLRERRKELLARWNSGEDRGGVTLEELKSLLTDWRASQQKPSRKVTA